MRGVLVILLLLAGIVAGGAAEAQVGISGPDEPVPHGECSPGPFVVFFSSGSARLRPDAVEILDHALEIRREGCGIGLVGIAGHADRSGRPSGNVALSRRRAAAVAHYLEAHGISPREVTLWAFGERRPWDETKDGLHERQNRRVEVILGPPLNK